MSFADSFPEKIKGDFAKRNIEIGKALFIRISNFNISYPKYWIIVGFSFDKKTIAGVIINTDINKNIFWNEELRKLNLLISQKNNSFLDYDSYVDCSKLHKSSFDEVYNAIVDNPKIVVGNVDNIFFEKIHQTIKEARTISLKDKRDFGFI